MIKLSLNNNVIVGLSLKKNLNNNMIVSLKKNLNNNMIISLSLKKNHIHHKIKLKSIHNVKN